MQASVTPNGTKLPATAKVPDLLAQSSNGDGECNNDIPKDTPLNRYQYIAGFLASNGFYVVSSFLPSFLISESQRISESGKGRCQ
jgi:hypothetical protein